LGVDVLEPVPARLVRTECQVVDEVEELARFKVPPPATVNNRWNRYWSTLEISATGDSRAAPEYVNIRQEVVQEGTSSASKT